MRKHIIWLIPIIYIISLLFIGTLQIWYSNTETLIEVTKLGLSWPVLTIIFLSAIIYLFEEPIRLFMLRIKGIHTDKIKIDTQQEEDPSKISLETLNNFILLRDSDWQKTIETVATAAERLIQEKEDIAGKLSNAVKELQENFILTETKRIKWHFKYADRFLAGRTKLFLMP